MRLVDSRTGIEIIDRDACLELLATEVVGRLGIVEGGSPRIFPVNYVLDRGMVVFRTAAGTKLERGRRGPACFEIDVFDRASRSGWSVLVVGTLEEVTPLQRAAWERIELLPLDPWAEGLKPYVLCLRPERISGRRVAPPDRAPDGEIGGATR